MKSIHLTGIPVSWLLFHICQSTFRNVFPIFWGMRSVSSFHQKNTSKLPFLSRRISIIPRPLYNDLQRTVFSVQTFLQLNEYKKPCSVPKAETKDNAVQLINASANWSVDSGRTTLKDISLTIKSGTLTTIIGEVGSGKVRHHRKVCFRDVAGE